AGDPMEAKLVLARFIVGRSHGEEAVQRAEEHFTRVVREGKAPEEMAEMPLPEGDPVHLPALLAETFGISTSEGRRLIGQGGASGGLFHVSWQVSAVFENSAACVYVETSRRLCQSTAWLARGYKTRRPRSAS